MSDHTTVVNEISTVESFGAASPTVYPPDSKVITMEEYTTPEVSYLHNNSLLSDVANMTVPAGCIVLRFDNFDFIPWDNPDNLVSKETEQTVDMLVAVVFLNILFLISVPTNIINMIVFYKQGLKERINLCLFSQAYADISFMLISYLIYVHRTVAVFSDEFRRGPLVKFILNHYLAGFSGFLPASGFMTMVIACERYFCVISPFKSQQILQTKVTAVVIVVSFLVLVGGFFLVGARWNIVCVYDPLTNTTSEELYPGQFYLNNEHFIDILDGVIYGVVLPTVFVTVTIVANAIIIYKLKKMATWRESTSSSAVSSRDVNLTRMLIGTSTLFVICTVPNVASCLLLVTVPGFSMSGRYYNALNLTFSIAELFGYINASFNFFIYYKIGSKFKKTVKELFGTLTKASKDKVAAAATDANTSTASLGQD